MAPEDPESRRIADALKRRERQGPGPGASMDPATLRAILEQHAGVVATLVGQIETSMAAKIDALANAQGAVAESLRREIEQGRERGDPASAAALERHLRKEQHEALEGLSNELKKEFAALKESLDRREGGVFAGVDDVSRKVMPAAKALEKLQQGVAGTTAAARNVAAIHEAVVDGRKALDEAAAIRHVATESLEATRSLVAMKPTFDRIDTGLERRRALTWFVGKFGITVLALLIVLLVGAGITLQRETGVWTPLAEVANRDRDQFWERHGAQVLHCIDVARSRQRIMACTIVDPDP